MARRDGKFLKGALGNLIAKEHNGKQIMQTKPVRVKQTEGTKKMADLFGMSSTFSKNIRRAFVGLYSGNEDGGMVNRLNKTNQSILSHYWNAKTGKFRFVANSFVNLIGFDFNVDSPLNTYFWVKPEVKIRDNILTVSLDEFKVADELTFPAKANFCTVYFVVKVYDLKTGYGRQKEHASFDVESRQEFVPAQEWTFETAEGCLALVGVGLHYYNRIDFIQTVINNPKLCPATICGAIYTPGDFVRPESPAAGPTIWRNEDVSFDS